MDKARQSIAGLGADSVPIASASCSIGSDRYPVFGAIRDFTTRIAAETIAGPPVGLERFCRSCGKASPASRSVSAGVELRGGFRLVDCDTFDCGHDSSSRAPRLFSGETDFGSSLKWAGATGRGIVLPVPSV